MRGRRTRAGALALLLALAALPLLAGCGGPDFSDFTGDLKFGDEQVADTQVTDVMQVPNGGLGKLIGDAQIEWVRCGQGRGCSGTKDTSRELMKRQPSYQCMALSNTSQAESPTQGTWNWDGGRHACVKTRKLSWLERTLWGMYRKQSQGTIEWLTTSRNTLKADSQGVATLRANASPQLLVVGYEREPVSQGRAKHSCRRRNQPHGGGRAARVVDRRRGIRRGRATARQDRMDLPRRVPRFFMRVHRTDVLRPSEQQRYRADTRHAVMVAGFRHGILPVGLGATSGRSVPADRRGRGCPCRRLPSGDHAGGAGACPVR